MTPDNSLVMQLIYWVIFHSYIISECWVTFQFADCQSIPKRRAYQHQIPASGVCTPFRLGDSSAEQPRRWRLDAPPNHSKPRINYHLPWYWTYPSSDDFVQSDCGNHQQCPHWKQYLNLYACLQCYLMCQVALNSIALSCRKQEVVLSPPKWSCKDLTGAAGRAWTTCGEHRGRCPQRPSHLSTSASLTTTATQCVTLRHQALIHPTSVLVSKCSAISHQNWSTAVEHVQTLRQCSVSSRYLELIHIAS